MSSGPWVEREQRWSRLWDNGPGGWVREALCAQVDTDLFFPDKGQASAPAKLICNHCKVKAQCLEYALTTTPVVEGIWGGTSERQRREIRAGRRVS